MPPADADDPPGERKAPGIGGTCGGAVHFRKFTGISPSQLHRANAMSKSKIFAAALSGLIIAAPPPALAQAASSGSSGTVATCGTVTALARAGNNLTAAERTLLAACRANRGGNSANRNNRTPGPALPEDDEERALGG